MKIALLVCDHVPVELQDEHGTYPEMFQELLRLPMEPFYVCDGHFPSVDDYDAFICTGSKFSVYDEIPWIVDLKALTREAYQAGKKYIGVCFGHQMIAEALGGRVERAVHGFLVGIHTFRFTQTTNWMNPPRDIFNALMLCQDQVHQMPPDSTLLARSEQCHFAMFGIGNHFLGIQGHPEFTNAYNRALFEKRLMPGEHQKKELALRSFKEKQADRELISAHMRNFLFNVNSG